jgi:sec-independent protein translocase protein TatC
VRLSAPERTTATGHLEELRWRLVICISALAVTTGTAYAFHNRLLALLDKPLGHGVKLVTLSVTEPFMTTVAVCVYLGVALAVPVALHQVWRFLSPALRPEQRRAARPYLLALPLLLGTGLAFGYFVVLGPAVNFLLGFGAETFDVQVRAQYYYSFAAMTLLGCGLVFLMPLVLVGLSSVGVVNAQMLRARRKVAVLAMIFIAALLPTADPVSLCLEALPLLALYEASIALIALRARRARHRTP